MQWCDFVRLPVTLFSRVTTRLCNLCTENHPPTSCELDRQLTVTLCRKGGWYRGYDRRTVSTRDTLYIFLGQTLAHNCVNDPDHLSLFVRRLADSMTNDGHVPYEFYTSWYYGDTPTYRSKLCKVPVIDSNMYFIMMVWWLQKSNPTLVRKLNLHCQRAWQWLNTFIRTDTLYEPVDASWETSRQHTGHLLLTNVLLIQTVRCMELIALKQSDDRHMKLYRKRHGRLLERWSAEIYKTQETLPKIIAVAFAMVPSAFTLSFNQQLPADRVALWVDGPIAFKHTTHAMVYGYDDQHHTVHWPWVGFLWMLVLIKRGRKDVARHWWDSYRPFHNPDTLYDMYCGPSPLNRAYLKSMPCHSLTIALQLEARSFFHGETV